MPRNFNLASLRDRLPANMSRDPRVIARAIIGVLLLANLIAAYTVFQPLGGSAEELDAQLATLSQQIKQKQIGLQRLRLLTDKMEKARIGGDQFMAQYFMTRRTASSTIVSELMNSAKESGIRAKEHSFQFEPIEGSDTLSMMTISANYEGSYGDLLQFVNRLDRSSRFLILESLAAAPQAQGGLLNVAIKLHTFVREDASTI